MKLKIALLFVLLSIFLPPTKALAVECDGNPPKEGGTLKQYADRCEQVVKELGGQIQTLEEAIKVLDSKIRLTQAQIIQTTTQIALLEKDITTLSTVLTDLDKTLTELTRAYLARVRESYIRRDPNPLTLFFSSDSFAKFFTRIRYLSVVKARDQLIISEMETARTNYDTQKNAKVRKQQEVEELKTKLVSQQVNLAAQQKGKRNLLAQTQNNERYFQALLDNARAELQAIQDAIAGKGVEVEEGHKNAGDKIASIIQGLSVCSTGSHLHLEIYKDNYRQNPATYLKQIDVTWNLCGWWGSCDPTFPFSGNLDWPLNPVIGINQGYGLTGYAKTGAYGRDGSGELNPHTGIDMDSNDSAVKAIASGTLYRGSLQVSYGCTTTGILRYVKMIHDGGLVSYYFHVNYN